MASEESTRWKEWVPLTALLDQVPQQVQRNLTTFDLHLTCLAALPHHLVMGTNVGLVYLAHLPSLNLMRLKCENPVAPISCVAGVQTVDDMIAAGAIDGTITIFQLPRVTHVPHTNSSNSSVLGLKVSSPVQPSVKRFTVGSIHAVRISSLSWSKNGMRLFTGDVHGVVAVIDINYQTLECTAKQLLKEESSITQLSYVNQLLAVTTLERALIFNTAQESVQQVGQKPRKHLGLFGCVWSSSISNMDAVLYTSRPGLRLWSANRDGEVKHTHIIKELPEKAEIQLVNPTVEKQRSGERFSFGLLFTMGLSHVVTYNPHWLFMIDINNLRVDSYTGKFRNITSVAVSEKEIFVLEGSRNVSCISTAMPDIGERRTPLPQKNFFPDAQNLLEIRSKLLTQGSDILDQIARVGSTVAAKVTSPPIVTGHDARKPVPSSASKTSDQNILQDRENGNANWQGPEYRRRPSLGSHHESSQRPFSPNLFPPRMVQSVTSFFPSLINSQSIVKTCGKTPNMGDLLSVGEHEVIEDFEEIVTSSQIVARDDADTGPLVMRESKKKSKRKNDATPSPDTISISSYKSTVSDMSEGGSSEVPSSPSTALSQCSTTSSGAQSSPDLHSTMKEGHSIIHESRGEIRAAEFGFVSGQDQSDDGVTVNISVTDMDKEDGQELMYDLQSADSRTYEDFKSNIEQNESLLAKVLDLSCLRMDHEEDDDKNDNSNSDSRYQHLEREHSLESGGGCSTPSTIKEQSPAPDDPAYKDFFAQFYSETSFSSHDSGGETSNQKIRKSSVENSYDGSNDGGERIESNSSEDRLSCLSYGPPSGSSLVSLTGHRNQAEGQDNTLEPRSMIPGNDSSEVADISWQYSTVDFQDSHEYEEEEMTGGWMKQRIPSNVCSLGISENTITFLDGYGCLYFKNTKPESVNQSWRKVRLTAKVTAIAMSPNNSILWILSESHAYAVGSPSLESVSPAKMVVAARSVKQMSLDDDVAWYIHEGGKVCVQLGLSSRGPSSMEYTVSCREFALIKVVCHAKVVWGLTDRGQLVFRIGVSSQSPMGHDWGQMKSPGAPVKNVALGPGHWGWIVDVHGRIFFRPGVCSENPQGREAKWWQVATSDYMMEQTSEPGSIMMGLSSKGIWLGEKGNNYIYSHIPDITGHVWSLFSQEVWSTVCAEGVYTDQGAICCLSPFGQLFIVNPNTASSVPLDVMDTECVISVAQRPEAIWVLTAAGDIFIRVGLSASSLHGSHWEQLDLHQIGDVHLCHLSCGTEVVWGVDTRGGVYMRQGPLSPPPSESLPPAWIQVDPTPLPGNASFTKVFVGPKLHMVWALDSSRRIYVREAIFPELPIGLSWVPVLGLPALHLTISENNVYALAPTGETFKRIGVTETNYIGDFWEKIPGNLAKISATIDDRLWGLNSSGYLCQHHSLPSANIHQELTSSTAHDLSLSSETEDWEML